MSIKGFLSGLWIQEKVRKSKQYKEAVQFANSYEPKKGKDYGWVLKHAVKDFECSDDRLNLLDEKADSLIGYLGAGSSLIALALGYGASTTTKIVVAATLPALPFLLAATIYAILARSPGALPALPTAYDAIKCNDAYEGEAEARFAAMVSASSAASMIATKEKARLVRRSFILFGLAVFVLVGVVIGFQIVRLVHSLHAFLWSAG